jgi:hypothetical protein
MSNNWFAGILPGVLSFVSVMGSIPAYSASLQSLPRHTSEDTNHLYSSATYCVVTNIQRGQLALRTSPNGNARAGLDNGMTVQYIRQQGIWYYVRVVMINNNNMQLLGLQGWVNSNYLYCGPDVDGPDV